MTLKSLRAWLKDWGRWHEHTLYPQNTIAIAMDGKQHSDGTFKSRPPNGVDAWRGVEALDIAMKKLSEVKDHALPISCVKLHYTIGPEAGCRELGFKKPRFYRRKEQGERAIMGFFAVRG